ncbi:MAG: DEAD/DEAH box helicase [Magnetococcales bacterium]|nr:DEAD/DEAH box helicase [Magnetococcales bacterium]
MHSAIDPAGDRSPSVPADHPAGWMDGAPDPVTLLKGELERRYAARIAAQWTVPARNGVYEALPDALHPALRDALIKRGIPKLYSHQAQAWQAVQAGKNMVVVTPTASGKTLCYNLPVLHAVLTDRAKALYLFPTKALSRDQMAEIHDLGRLGDLSVRADVFDGDTPADARRAVRTRSDIIVSNPDMLHQGILPHHTKWAQFFENLRYVVIDEMHVYRGVFGSHMANVLRRLRRICRFYRSEPIFILCSATIANPGELAQWLVGDKVTQLTGNGAPQGERHVLLWNPPVINPDLGLRASARSQTSRIAKQAVDAGLRTIVFSRTRLMVEVMTKYLKDRFDRDPRHAPRIAAYRGGYLPTERRRTEAQLREGSVDCVVATSALELGVDIGALDVCVLNGYPGSIAGVWQRFGRAGRRQRPALGVLVATSEALDQFIMTQPEFLKERSPEQARIDPDQVLVLLDHVRCAAFELPFKQGDRFGGSEITELLEYLAEEGLLHREGKHWRWIADSYPANSVSLRSISEGNFVVVDSSQGGRRVIAEVDYPAAAMTLYEQAIYMVQSRPYQVERLDWEGRKAFVRPTEVDYYTDAIDYTRLKVLDQFDATDTARGERSHGEVHLVRRVAGFKKIRYYTHENIGYGHIHLPDQEMHTTAVWWQARAKDLEALFPDRWRALDGFLGAAYTLRTVAAIRVMADRRDLGQSVGDEGVSEWSAALDKDGRGGLMDAEGVDMDPNLAGAEFQPTVYLYDNYPGGVGLAPALFNLGRELVLEAEALIDGCPCQTGCPACVGPIRSAPERDAMSAKQAARLVLSCFAER